MTDSKQIINGLIGDYKNFTVESVESIYQNSFDGPGYPVSGDQIAKSKELDRRG